jgi:hypothetical protein
LRVAQEKAEPATPETDVEDEFGKGLSLLPGELPVGPEGAIEHPLRGTAREDEREGLGGEGSQSVER